MTNKSCDHNMSTLAEILRWPIRIVEWYRINSLNWWQLKYASYTVSHNLQRSYLPFQFLCQRSDVVNLARSLGNTPPIIHVYVHYLNIIFLMSTYWSNDYKYTFFFFHFKFCLIIRSISIIFKIYRCILIFSIKIIVNTHNKLSTNNRLTYYR